MQTLATHNDSPIETQSVRSLKLIQPSTDILAFALHYATFSMGVFPVHFVKTDGTCSCENSKCERVGKHPMTVNGFKSASTNPDYVRSIFTENPDANIGIRTGAESGIVVVDIDPRHDGHLSLQTLVEKYRPLPPTPTVKTGGGGYHFYFRHPGGHVGNRAAIVPGIDVRGDGGYVLGAGSNHVMGEYSFWPGLALNQVPLAAMPQWLLDLVLTKSPKSPSTLAGSPILDGQRNDTLFRLGCSMRRKGMSNDGVEAALRAENLARCTPPLGDDEIADIMKSVSKYPASLTMNDQGTTGAAAFERGDEVELAQSLVATMQRDGEIVFDRGHFYQYQPTTGLWQPLPHETLSQEIQKFAGRSVYSGKEPGTLRISSRAVNGTIALAAARVSTPDFFTQAAPGVAFTNGFVEVSHLGIQLDGHCPDNRATFGFPFLYEPCAKAPQFEKFLADIFLGDADGDAKRELLREFVGACLIGVATRQAKALVLVGEGRNGKSTFIRMIEALFPAGARAAIPPQLFEQEYYRAELEGKRLNSVSELPKADILRAESFKAIIAGDPIIARVIRNDPRTITPIAGHVFAANALPSTDDLSRAFWSRFLLVTFNREFKEHEQDKFLADRIIEQELPGVAAWALEGARRLMERNPMRYTEPPSHALALGEWKGRADQVAQFVEEMCRPTELLGERATGSALYAAYSKWAEVNGHRRMNNGTFGKRLKALGVKEAKPGNVRLYHVKLNSETPDPVIQVPFTKPSFPTQGVESNPPAGQPAGSPPDDPLDGSEAKFMN